MNDLRQTNLERDHDGRTGYTKRGTSSKITGGFLKVLAAGVVLAAFGGRECLAQGKPIATGTWSRNTLVAGYDVYRGMGIQASSGWWEMYPTSSNASGYFLRIWTNSYPGVYFAIPDCSRSYGKYTFFHTYGYIYSGSTYNAQLVAYREGGFMFLDLATFTGAWATQHYYFGPSQIYYEPNPGWWTVTF